MHDGTVTVIGAAPSVGAVVVFYYPDAACIERANRLAALMHCVVVDNTPSMRSAHDLGLDSAVEFLPNGENFGIAVGINRGIEALIRAGYDVAIIFDQDSEPPAALLNELPRVMSKADAASAPVALVGPAYDDPRLGGVAPFVRFSWLRLERIKPYGTEPIDVDFLISSGSCINLRYWKDIGPMDDGLFIDFVDVEWCVRARRKGYRVLGVPWIRMSHELGGEPVRVLGRRYPMHSPLRHYYQFRNALVLMGRPYMPWRWKSVELIKLPIRLVIYGFFPAQRKDHLAMAWRGVCDGLLGRLGPYHRN